MSDNTKLCPKCEQTRPIEEFHRKKDAPDGRQRTCIPCRREFERTHREEIAAASAKYYRKRKGDPEFRAKHKHWLRSWKLRQYGLSLKDYDAMVAAQSGRCAICACPQTQNKGGRHGSQDFCVDHDHRTGRVRGLLCHHCNKAIGMLRDSVTLARGVAAYLVHHGAIDEYRHSSRTENAVEAGV